MRKDYEIKIYTKSEELPPLLEGNFFHSLELFEISERVPGDTPFMAVAMNGGKAEGQLLAVLHSHHTWFPPFLYTHAHAHGEGTYVSEEAAEKAFPLLLHALTRELCHKHCLYIEFSEIQKKMFGYRHFRRAGFFPIAWQEIYNSLHSMDPLRRLTDRARQQIDNGKKRGMECHATESIEEVRDFYRLYKNFYRFKPRRYVPPLEYFEEMSQCSEAKVFVSTYTGRKKYGEEEGEKEEKGKIVGGCTLALSEKNAYLWHLASRRKRYLYLHPDTMTVWHAISYAHEHGYEHIHFMDVGLPWKRNPFRDFIRSFGGKPVAKFRWFRFNIGILNQLLKWLNKQ